MNIQKCMMQKKKAITVLGSLTILKVYICFNKTARDTTQKEKANLTTTVNYQTLNMVHGGSRLVVVLNT